MPEGRKKTYNLTAIFTGIFLIGAVFSYLSFLPSVLAATGINEHINFQGKVVNTDGTNVTNGSYTFLFCIYTTATPTTACTSGADNDAIWRESKSITVTDGIFQTNLGDTTTLPGAVDFNTDNIYLGINFNANGQMTPLVRFTAAPYALNAAKVSGLTVTDTTGTLTIPNAKTISFADAFTTSGAFATTLTSTGTTNVTLPTTGTLATLAGAETLTNKTIGSTGLTFSGATTDITTASGESLVITAAGAGTVDIQDTLTADSLTLDTGSLTLQNSEVIGNGTDDLLTFVGAGGTDNTDLYIDLDGTSPVIYSNTDDRVSIADFLNVQVSGVTGAAAGDIWYDSAANKFKINENGTTKTLCNITDGGCGGGGSLTVRETDTSPSVASVATLEFGPTGDSTADFVVSDQTGGVVRVVLGSNVAHLNVAETVSGGWTFNTATTNFVTTIDARGDVSDSTGNLTLNDDVDISGALALSGTSLTATSATTITFGSTGADTITVGNGGADTITIGGAAATGVSITDNNWSVTTAGVGAFVSGTVIGSQTFTTNNIADSGALTIASGAATGLTLNSGTTGTIAIGDDASAETINIGTGAAAKTITFGSTNTTSTTTIQSGTGGINLVSEGSAEGMVQIGTGGAGSTTPDLLALDAKSDAGDPATTVEGTMYYNQNTNKFRCYQASAWTDCIGSGGSVDLSSFTSAAIAIDDTLPFTDVSNSNTNSKDTLENVEWEQRKRLPNRGFNFYTDFIQETSATATDNGLAETNSGTGAATTQQAINGTGRPGLVRSTTGTTATGRSALSSGVAAVAFNGGSWFYETAVNVTTLSTSTERYQLLIGFRDTLNAANQVDGVYFLYDEGGVSTGSTAAAYWQTVTASNSTRTFNASLTQTTVNAATWVRLGIEINAAGTSVTFYIDGTAVATHTANIPTGTARALGFGTLIIKSVGTTARTVDFDYVNVVADLTTAR